MTIIRAGDRRFDVDLIIFDKDGTLFDFWAMWATIFQRQAQLLRDRLGEAPVLFADLYRAMGFDPTAGTVDPYGPLALAEYDEIQVIITVVLYEHGWSWTAATALVADVTAVAKWPPLTELVRPIGDVSGLLRRLTSAGVQVGIVTTDLRAMTETMLDLVQAAPFVAGIVCADEEGVALKPSPAGILELCRRLGVLPARALMVGDSPTDLTAARAAGLAGAVGVTSGVSSRADLEPLAEVVLGSVQELRVEDNSAPAAR